MTFDLRDEWLGPLADVLDSDARARLEVEVLDLPRPTSLFARGEAAQSYDVVLDGAVELLDPDGRVVSAVGSGEAVRPDVPLLLGRWPFDGRARAGTRLLRLKLAPLEALLARDWSARRHVERVLGVGVVRRFRGQLLRVGVPGAVIVKLMDALEDQELEEGATLGRRGRRAGRLVLVERGTVEASYDINGMSVVVSSLGQGDSIGLSALLDDAPLDATYVAKTPVQVLALPREHILRVAVEHPELMAYLRTSAGRSAKRERDSVGRPPPDPTTPLAEFTAAQNPIPFRQPKPVWIAQHDHMDCGAACMAMVAHTWGRRIGTAAYRAEIHVTRDGASMWSLLKAAAKTGFKATGVRTGLKSLGDMHLPAIVLMNYHFVVVFKVSEDHVLVGDPARGIVRLPRDAFLKDWSGTALLLRPTEALFSYPETHAAHDKYLQLLRGGWRVLAEAMLASLVVLLLGMGIPILTQILFDRVLLREDHSELRTVTMAMLAVGGAYALVSAARAYLLGHAATRFGIVFSTQFYKTILHLPLSFFAVRRTGDILSRFGEIRKIRDLLTRDVLSAGIDAAALFFYVGVLFAYHAQLGLITLFGLPLLAALSATLSTRVRESHREVFGRRSALLGKLVEIFRGFETIKALNAELAARWRIESEYRRQVDSQLTLIVRRLLLAAVTTGFAQLLMTLLFYRGADLAIHRELTIGQAIAASQIAALAFAPVRRLVTLWTELQGAAVAFGRVEDVITSRPERDDRAEAVGSAEGTEDDAGQRLKGRVELRRVWFQYGSDASPWVLRGVDLKIREGETVALVGRSGSGKTTLAQMLAMLYRPTKGELLLDGRRSTDWPLADVRRSVGMVVQAGDLFSGTILENIAYGDEQPNLQRAMAAARAADAHEFIQGLSGGYETRLSEGGSGLSGGQRQRICIARCFYRHPSIVILDEATSNLDAESEKAVVEGMQRFCEGRTAIIIAHRLSTVLRADRVVMLEKGQIVDDGPHFELVAKGGPYAELFGAQLAL